MKSTLLTLFAISLLASTSCFAQYISSTTSSGNNPFAYRCSTNQAILRVEIEIGTAPVLLSEMTFNTNGSDNPASDISNSKLYFYNDSNFFDLSQAILIDTWIPNGSSPWATNFTFMDPFSLNGSSMLPFSGMVPGKNYFWVTYDIKCTATQGNHADACFVSGKADGVTFTPTLDCPEGSSDISQSTTGMIENLNTPVHSIYPVPTNNNISIDLNASITNPISLELLDITGKKIDILFDGIPQENEGVLNFSLEKYPSGIYLIRSSCEGKVSLSKVVIL